MGKARTTASALTVALGLTLVGAGMAGADPVNYTGRFDGEITASGCEEDAPFKYEGMQAGGTWRVNLHEDKATVRFVITVDGELHVAWTAQIQRVPDAGAVFKAELPGLGADGLGTLTITLEHDGAFSYVIHPYDFSAYGWGSCESVTYPGVID